MFFLEFSCFFDDPADVGNLISGFSAFSKTNLDIWKFKFHVLLKPGLENFEHYFTIVWAECNCAVVWAFFGTAFLWDWNENWPFPVPWPLLSFPNLLTYWVHHFIALIKSNKLNQLYRKMMIMTKHLGSWVCDIVLSHGHDENYSVESVLCDILRIKM